MRSTLTNLLYNCAFLLPLTKALPGRTVCTRYTLCKHRHLRDGQMVGWLGGIKGFPEADVCLVQVLIMQLTSKGIVLELRQQLKLKLQIRPSTFIQYSKLYRSLCALNPHSLNTSLKNAWEHPAWQSTHPSQRVWVTERNLTRTSVWPLCLQSAQELGSFAGRTQIHVSAFTKPEISLFIGPLDSSLGLYWVMARSVLDRTKG